MGIGAADIVALFVRDLVDSAPPLSSPSIASIEIIDPIETNDFAIVDSLADADAQVFVPPDYFMCDDCRRELMDLFRQFRDQGKAVLVSSHILADLEEISSDI